MTTVKTVYCPLFILLLGVIAALLPSGDVIHALPVLYLGALVASVYCVYDKNDLVLSCFRPSSIMAIYVSLFFLVGAYAFKHELVLMHTNANQFEYYSLKRIGMVSCFFFSAIAVTLLSQNLSNMAFLHSRSRTYALLKSGRKRAQVKGGGYLLSLATVLLTPFVEIPLPGGSGSFSSTFFMFGAIHISYASKLNGRAHRFLIYVLLAVLLAVFFYNDRRLLIFFGFILGFIEVYDKRPFRVRLRPVLLTLVVAASLIVAHLAMTIHRGVGAFESKSIVDAFSYVDDYLSSDWAQTMLLHNFESAPTLFHSYRGVDYMMETGSYRYGLTFVKVIFLPVPRHILPEKPRSMVDEYNLILYPAYRSVGGSWIPNFYTEAFWNFGFIGGMLFLLAVFSFMDWQYRLWMLRLRTVARIENVFFLSSVAFLPFLFRGSGLDLYGLFVLIFLALSCLHDVLFNSRSNVPRRVVRNLPQKACGFRRISSLYAKRL